MPVSRLAAILPRHFQRDVLPVGRRLSSASNTAPILRSDKALTTTFVVPQAFQVRPTISQTQLIDIRTEKQASNLDYPIL
jgi:hypothetical protein